MTQNKNIILRNIETCFILPAIVVNKLLYYKRKIFPIIC